MLKDAYADALTLVWRFKGAVEKLATALVERRALDGEEAAEIIASYRRHAPAIKSGR